MERRKWFYSALILLTLVSISFFVIVWQSWGAHGGGAQSPPRLTQSAAAAAKVLQAWLTDNWAGDGVVVACTLTLLRSAAAENVWTFQVYSAQANRLLVAVVQEQEVRVLRDITALYRPRTLPDAAWKRDTDSILRVWWRAGGATAWNLSATSALTMHLSMREDGVPAWQLTLEKNMSGHGDAPNVLEYWEIRADTGVLLEHSSTGGW